MVNNYSLNIMVQTSLYRKSCVMNKKLLLTGIAALLLTTGAAQAETINPADILVLDGDTIRIHNKQPNIRLVGFNAPETRNAACNAEKEPVQPAPKKGKAKKGKVIAENIGPPGDNGNGRRVIL